MAGFEKRAQRYPTDLTDEEWLFIQPYLRTFSKRGHRPITDLRDGLDALRYLARTGGGWRMLLNDFPPWQTVYWWFRRFVCRLLFQTIPLCPTQNAGTLVVSVSGFFNYRVKSM